MYHTVSGSCLLKFPNRKLIKLHKFGNKLVKERERDNDTNLNIKNRKIKRKRKREGKGDREFIICYFKSTSNSYILLITNCNNSAKKMHLDTLL